MMSEKLGTPQRFIIVGAGNTLVGLFVIYLCKWQLGIGDVTANFSGYIVGLVVSFFLNRAWTFRHSEAVFPALMRFLLVFLIAYSTNLLAVVALIKFIDMNSYLAHAIAIVPYAIFFYFGSRYFAFKIVAVQSD